MKPESIFAPVSVLALWTGFVLLLTGVRRVRGIATGRIPAFAGSNLVLLAIWLWFIYLVF